MTHAANYASNRTSNYAALARPARFGISIADGKQGAAAGAAIGTLFPGVGNVIGGAAGFVIGAIFSDVASLFTDEARYATTTSKIMADINAGAPKALAHMVETIGYVELDTHDADPKKFETLKPALDAYNKAVADAKVRGAGKSAAAYTAAQQATYAKIIADMAAGQDRMKKAAQSVFMAEQAGAKAAYVSNDWNVHLAAINAADTMRQQIEMEKAALDAATPPGALAPAVVAPAGFNLAAVGLDGNVTLGTLTVPRWQLAAAGGAAALLLYTRR